MSAIVDVLVVGGGIHGVGVAQAAAAAGHSVLLVEQAELAAGTSSRSSKLIHGGLRYLESAQWPLVRESLRERSILLRLAPELVQLKRFIVPLYADTRRQPWQLRIGLAVYAVLAGFGPAARFGTLPRTQWSTLDGLETRGLEQVFWYQDGQTDDRLLTEAVMRSAVSLGAELQLHARFLGARCERAAVTARIEQEGVISERSARVLINAAGPWAAGVAGSIAPALAIPALELVQGSHLMLPGRLTEGIYYLESRRDGRAIFVMPRGDATLVGTTEHRYSGDPSRVAPTDYELNYLLQVIRYYFPARRHTRRGDILHSFAGLRVLPAGTGHAFHRSRETLLVTDRRYRPQVLSIYGGKLTGWRAVAARVLQNVAATLPARTARARTDQLPLAPA